MSAGPQIRAADGAVSHPTDADLARLLLIRHFELTLLDLFARGAVPGTTHTCLGQEHIPVAVSPLLTSGDFVFSNHRGHGHYLARYDDPAGLLAEILGRTGSVCNAAGGSQHLLRDGFLSTGVQGQSLPVAAGVALHLSRTMPGALACAYIGDGTLGEGAVYEALNLASLWHLPLLVVVENNGIAQSTPTDRQLAGTVAGRAAAFGVAYHRTASIDVADIRAHLAPLLARIRCGSGPLLVEFVTHRVGPHSKGDDARHPDEMRVARAGDWYPRYAAEHADRFAAVEAAARERIARVVADVTARPPAHHGGAGW